MKRVLDIVFRYFESILWFERKKNLREGDSEWGLEMELMSLVLVCVEGL